MRSFLSPLVLALIGASPVIAQIQMLESGAAITDPAVLAPLELDHYSLGRMLFPNNPDAGKMKNNNLFDGPMKPVADILIRDIDTLPQASLDPDARRIFQQADSAKYRFSSCLLNHPSSGFVLTGI